jgi:uncharacterized protein with PQ loop repeat
METIQEGFGWVATGLTIFSFISPVFPYLNVLRGKLNFEDTPAVLVTTCYVNYFCWYVYGDMIFSDQIKFCYMSGSFINLILMIIYLIYEIRRYLVDTILNTLILITGTWALYRALTIIIDDDRIVGKICVGTSCIVFLSQVQIIYKVLKDRNYNLIPIYNCWIALFYSICWVVYGIFITDFYVVFPNAICIVLSLVQVIMYINLSKKYPAIGKNEFSSTIGIETTSNEETKKEDTPIKIDEESDVKGKEKPVKIYNN